jgi:hypothetical protein
MNTPKATVVTVLERQLSAYSEFYNELMVMWEKDCQRGSSGKSALLRLRTATLEKSIYDTLDHIEFLRNKLEQNSQDYL